MADRPVKTIHHVASVVSLKGLGGEVKRVKGFNAKLAVILTKGVGTMACAYLFCIIALVSLPAIITETGWVSRSTFPHFVTSAGLILIVSWIAQTFIQLVLLSVIMVGQAVQTATSDARAENAFDDTEFIKNQVNENTDGGLRVILDRLAEIEARLPAQAT